METITTDELLDRLESGRNVQLVNVLDEDHFEEAHIPGSMNIPLDQLEDEADERLDRDQEVIVYCASEECGASDKAWELLDDMGFDVKDYAQGTAGWQEEVGHVHPH